MKRLRFKRPSRFLLKLSLILSLLFLTLGGVIGLGVYSTHHLQTNVQAIGHIRASHDRLYKIVTLVERHLYEGDTARSFTSKEIAQEEEAVRKVVYGLRDGDKSLGLSGARPPRTTGLPNYTEEWWLRNRYVSSYLNTVKLNLGEVLRANPGEEGYLMLSRFRDNVDRYASHLRDMGSHLQQGSFKELRRFQLLQYACMGAGIITVVVSSYFMVAFMYVPIKRTSKGMELIRQGRWEHRIPISSRDEVGDMARGFNLMAKELALKTSDLKTALEELHTSHTLLDNTLSRIGLFIRVIEPETHRVLFQNQPLQNLFPHGLERPCYTIWQRKEVCEFCVCQEAIKTRMPQKKEMEGPGGSLYEVQAFLLPNPDGTVNTAIEVIKDITLERQRERELEDTRLQLFQAQKLVAVGQMAGGIAHSINNPLSGITLYSDVLLKKTESLKENPVYEDLKKGLNIMKESATRCETVVKDLLRISRKPKLEMVPTQVNEAVEHCLTMVEPQMRLQRIKLEKNLSGDLPQVLGSHTELETVFINLFSNAIDVTKEAGTLTVESYLNEVGTQVVVSITDTGCGIPEADLPYIFNPYFTTKPPGKGTGLGLSTSLLIIQGHKGTIEVESQVGKGTRFIVSLPAMGASPPPPQMAEFKGLTRGKLGWKVRY
ncbi:MAG TPA: ATP-binding protein [Candidatus Hypogeohydataceae bacterium YC38]